MCGDGECAFFLPNPPPPPEALPGVFVVETMTLLAGSGDTYRAAVDLLAQRLFVSLAVEELGAREALGALSCSVGPTNANQVITSKITVDKKIGREP